MKQNVSTAFNYIIGMVGIILLVMGYILTTGGLNIMDMSEKYGPEPGDVFSAPVLVVLFIIVPALLIRGSIGKYLSIFKFSNKFIAVLAVISLFTGTIAAIGKTYNYFSYADEEISAYYENIDVLYKKRIDLTIKIEGTLKQYMEYEGSTFTEIANARSNYFGSSNVNGKVEAANSLDQGIKSLIVAVENYPELKANETVASFVNVIVSSEEEIANKKQSYNNKVREYNTNLRTFPTVVIARMFGFETKAYFVEDSIDVKGLQDIRL